MKRHKEKGIFSSEVLTIKVIAKLNLKQRQMNNKCAQ